MEKRFKKSIDSFREEGSTESLMEVLKTVADMYGNNLQVITPVDIDESRSGEELKPEDVSFRHIQNGNGENFLVAFTSMEEHKMGPDTNAMFMALPLILQSAREEEDITGVVINPWTDSFMLMDELMDIVISMNEEKKVRSTSLEEDFYLHAVEEKPLDLYGAVAECCISIPAVNRVWCAGLNNKGKECYLLIVDFEGEEIGSLFSRILESLPALKDGKRIEMTPYTGNIPESMTDLIYVK